MEKPPISTKPAVNHLQDESTSGDHSSSTVDPIPKTSDHLTLPTSHDPIPPTSCPNPSTNVHQIPATSDNPTAPANVHHILATSENPTSPTNVHKIPPTSCPTPSTNVHQIPPTSDNPTSSTNPIPATNISLVSLTSSNIIPRTTADLNTSTTVDTIPYIHSEQLLSKSIKPHMSEETLSGLDTSEDTISGTDTLSSSSEDEQPRKKLKVSELQSDATRWDPVPSGLSSGEQFSLASNKPQSNAASSETDVAFQIDASTADTTNSLSGEDTKSRKRLQDFKNCDRGKGTQSKDCGQSYSENRLIHTSRIVSYLETDTAVDSDASTDTASSSSDDDHKQPKKKLRESSLQNDPTSSWLSLLTGYYQIQSNRGVPSDVDLSDRVKPPEAGHENDNFQMYEDISDASSHSGDENDPPSPRLSNYQHCKITRDPVPSTSRYPVPSTSRYPVPSTSRYPVPSTSRDPVPSVSTEERKPLSVISLLCDEQLPPRGNRTLPKSVFIRAGDDLGEKSPDEKIRSSVEKADRILEENVIMEKVESIVNRSSTSMDMYLDFCESAVKKKEHSFDKVCDYHGRLNFSNIHAVQSMHSHFQVYRNALTSWKSIYEKLLKEMDSAKKMQKKLKERLQVMAAGRMNLEEADEIYDTIDKLEGTLFYLKACLDIFWQRGNVLNLAKDKMGRVSGLPLFY